MSTPPLWATALLRGILPIRDRDSIPGDLLEEYRESIEPCLGKAAADRWYVRHVIGMTVRAHGAWVVLFAVTLAGRNAVDAFFPTHDFRVRSAVTTDTAVALWVAAGFVWSWRTALLRSAPLGGAIAAASACVANGLLSAMLIGVIAMTHNELAWAGIQSSGGWGEMFAMPLVLLVPATMLSTIGGAGAVLVRRLRA
jgi:hypothetical protein